MVWRIRVALGRAQAQSGWPTHSLVHMQPGINGGGGAVGWPWLPENAATSGLTNAVAICGEACFWLFGAGACR